MSVEQNGRGYYDQAGEPAIISREGHVEDIASVLSPEHFEVFVGLPRKSHQLLFEASYLASLSDPDEADKAMLAIYNKWFCDGVDPEDETTLGELAAFGDSMPMHIERYVTAKHRVLGMASLRSAIAAHLEREQINAEQAGSQLADVIDLDVRRGEATEDTDRTESERLEHQAYVGSLRAELLGYAAAGHPEYQVKALRLLLDREASLADSVDVAPGRPILRRWLEDDATNQSATPIRYKARDAVFALADYELPKGVQPRTMHGLVSRTGQHNKDVIERLVLEMYHGMMKRQQDREIQSQPRPAFSPANMPRHIVRHQTSEEVVETQGEPQPDTQSELDVQNSSLQLREQNYVVGIFGGETIKEATIEDRTFLAQAVAHMHLFKRRKRQGSDDTPLERMNYFFSDMSYEDIIQKAKQAGRAGSSISERAFYSNTKTAITEKFTQEQARLVLEMVQNGEVIDWSAVGALEGDDSLRDEVDPRPRKKQTVSRAPLPELPKTIVDLDVPEKIPEEDATPLELKAFAERARIDLAKDDVFMIAYRPPKDWQKSESFKARFDDLTTATIERAVQTTRLTEANANFIKSKLGLPVVIRSGDSRVPEKPLEYLRAIESSTPGRLARAQEYPRIGAMTTALRLFTNNKLAIDGVVEKFGNNPEAGLLLKGAIVEVMLASMQAAAKNKARYEQQ